MAQGLPTCTCPPIPFNSGSQGASSLPSSQCLNPRPITIWCQGHRSPGIPAGPQIPLECCGCRGDLWAAMGKRSNEASYSNPYTVEYRMVQGPQGWQISDALVLGR